MRSKLVLAMRGALMALLLAQAAAAPAATAQAEGVAVIGAGGLTHARQLAVRDALNQLGMRNSARVDVAAGSKLHGATLDSSRVQPGTEFTRYRVLREWQSSQLLHVQIAVEEEDARPSGNINLGYKKKVVVTPFHVRRSPQLDDVDAIATGLPQELLRRLSASGKFLGKESAWVIAPGATGPSNDLNAVRRIATLAESQFVIAGEIIDASQFEQPAYYGLIKKPGRRIELAFYVYDGLSGALLAHRTALVEQVGAPRIGRDKAFGSASFAATPFGGAILRALDDGVAAITQDLAALPFMAKVVQVQGERIFIDAGSTSSMAPGDQLVVYRVDPRQPVYGNDQLAPLGNVETPLGTVKVVQVQPGFSIVNVTPVSAARQLSAGDVVRFDVALAPASD